MLAWVLCLLLEATNAAAPADYRGVFISNDKAMMAMGAKYDVKLTRTPTGKLKIDATGVEFVTKKDGVTLNGSPLGGADCSKDTNFAATKKIVDGLVKKNIKFPLDGSSKDQLLVNGATLESYITTIANARIKANQKTAAFKKHINTLVEKPCKWEPLGSTYFFRTECLNWADARAACKKGGGDLVVITDKYKNARVTAYMKKYNDYKKCNGPYPWLGAYDCQRSGNKCKWVDGSPWSYKGPNSWNVDDPHLHFYTNGHWGTWNTKSKSRGICEGISKKAQFDNGGLDAGLKIYAASAAWTPKQQIKFEWGKSAGEGTQNFLEFTVGSSIFINRPTKSGFGSKKGNTIIPLTSWKTNVASLNKWFGSAKGAEFCMGSFQGHDTSWGVVPKDNKEWGLGCNSGGWKGRGAYYSEAHYKEGWVGEKDSGQCKGVKCTAHKKLKISVCKV